MMTLTSLVFLVVVCSLLVSASSYSSPESCCPRGSDSEGFCASCFQQPPCKNVTYLATILDKNVYYTPLYMHVVADTIHTRRLDNVCYSYYMVDRERNQFLVFISEVLKDGSNNVQIYFVADVPNHPGEVRFEGFARGEQFSDVSQSVLVGTDFVLGKVCKGLFFYRCFEFQGCDHPNNALHGTKREVDYVYGMSNTTSFSDPCKKQMADLARSEAFPLNKKQQILYLPNTKPWACVTSFYGAECINAKNVKQENSFSYP